MGGRNVTALMLYFEKQQEVIFGGGNPLFIHIYANQRRTA
jgi:hypothetical protein